MTETKKLVSGAFLVGISVLFQIAPVIFTEAFVILTIFSAVPIYIISRGDTRLGLAGYIAVAITVTLFSVHEGLFFLFTNGIVGLSLGVIRYHTNKKLLVIGTSSLLLTAALLIMNYGIGINVFGMGLRGSAKIQVLILFVFSVFYNSIYYIFSEFVYKKVSRYK